MSEIAPIVSNHCVWHSLMRQATKVHTSDPTRGGTQHHHSGTNNRVEQIQHRITRVRPMVERTMGGTMEMRQGPRGQRVGWRGRQAVWTIDRHHKHLQSCSLWRGRESRVLLMADAYNQGPRVNHTSNLISDNVQQGSVRLKYLLYLLGMKTATTILHWFRPQSSFLPV